MGKHLAGLFFKVVVLLGISLWVALPVLAATYHAPNIDGNVSETSDWNSDEKLGNNANVLYYLTWDADYLYVGFKGGAGDADEYNVLLDLDPDDTGADNAGTTTDFCGAWFGDDGKPDYAFQASPSFGSDALYDYQANGGGWDNTWESTNSLARANGSCDGSTNCVEIKISWADIGFTNRSQPLGLYLYTCYWQDSSARTYSAWPPSNQLQRTGTPEYFSTRVYLPATDSSRAPRSYHIHRGDQTALGVTAGSYSLLNGFAQINIDSVIPSGSCDFRVNVRGNAAADSENSAMRRRYKLTHDCTSIQADITLMYMDGNYEAESELNGHDENSLELWRWDGSSWQQQVVNGRDTTNNTLTKYDVTIFSDWAVGSSQPTAVTLYSLTARTAGFSSQMGILLLSIAALVGVALLWRRLR